jgi:hypothetical protein
MSGAPDKDHPVARQVFEMEEQLEQNRLQVQRLSVELVRIEDRLHRLEKRVREGGAGHVGSPRRRR